MFFTFKKKPEYFQYLGVCEHMPKICLRLIL